MSSLRTTSTRTSFCFLLGLCLLGGGCASRKNPAGSSLARAAQPSENTLPSGPDAKINISYSQPGDFLSSLTVTEYSAAETVLTESDKGPPASIVRFEGGVVIWEIGMKKKLLANVPVLGEGKSYAVRQITYGKLPANLVSTIPDSGPPQPLQADHYYIFAATRASGATSYEAVKVNGDGSLEAYAADPRAGDSFRLCCDIAADFIVNANAMTTPENR
jgi:hypothetical protein